MNVCKECKLITYCQLYGDICECCLLAHINYVLGCNELYIFAYLHEKKISFPKNVYALVKDEIFLNCEKNNIPVVNARVSVYNVLYYIAELNGANVFDMIRDISHYVKGQELNKYFHGDIYNGSSKNAP